ncbi:MAG: hypothetical protein QM658_03120 [Gordonia sp. (in: high G+C Gram-positive bacteria)]
MPTNQTSSSIRGKALRITKLDACGGIVYGTKSSLVTDGFIKIDLKQEKEDGEETNQKNANGKLCIVDKAPPQLKYMGAEMEFCGVNPEMASMITGQPVILNAAGDAVGVPIGETIESWFALEVWADIPGAACGSGGARPYFYYVLPFMTNGTFGDFTIEEKAATFSMTAETRAPNAWGKGPYKVDLDDSATPVPAPLFQPVRPTDHLWPQRVYVAPPAPTAGAVALTAPVGP